jgi:amidase
MVEAKHHSKEPGKMRSLLAILLVLGGTIGPAQAQPFQLMDATIDDVKAAIASKQISCRALVEQYIARIEAYDKRGPALNAVQTINPLALDEAALMDGIPYPVGPLHCVPVLMKDQVEMKTMPTTYGSAVFKDFVPQRDATIVTRLRKAGAIIIAKTTMGEYAQGYLGSAFGVVRNAYDPSRTASGSSGGTGAGIAANYATVGIGEDTGGSIRGPAAVNNLVGLRPTVPLVSRFGMLPARPTTDTLGLIGRSVKDVAIVLDAIAGYDSNDPVTAESVGRQPASYTQFLDADGLKAARIGIIREPLDPKADTSLPEFKAARAVLDRAIEDMQRLGAIIVDAENIPDFARRSADLYEAMSTRPKRQ